MSGNQGTLVKPQRIGLAIQSEEGHDRVKNVRFYKRGAETAIVLGVVDQQGGPRSAQGRQSGIVLRDEKICGVLLDVPGFFRKAFQSALQIAIARDRNRYQNSRIKAA